MPFRSKRQQRFMYATKPKGVDLKEWAEKTDFDKIPEKVRKKKRKRKSKDKDDALTLNDEILTMASEYERQVNSYLNI